MKINANQRYATTAITSAILRQVAERAKVPLQVRIVKSKMVVQGNLALELVSLVILSLAPIRH